MFFGVQLWKNWAFHHPSIQIYISFLFDVIMSETNPHVPENPISDDEINEEERLRIRKNCRIVR